MADLKSKILQRHHYSARTLSVFQVVAAYFTNIYYDYLYIEAQKAKANNQWPTVTLSYRHACNAFLTAIDYTSKKHYKVENYTQLLMGITEHFKEFTTFSTMSINECIDKMVREFVPEDFFATTDRDTRRNIIRNVLTSLIRAITASVATEFLVPIIDAHDDEENAPALLERIVDLLLYEREMMYQKFMNGGRPERAERNITERVTQDNKKLLAEIAAWKSRSQQMLADLKTKAEQLAELAGVHQALTEKHRALIEELGRSRAALQVAQNTAQIHGQTAGQNITHLQSVTRELQQARYEIDSLKRQVEQLKQEKHEPTKNEPTKNEPTKNESNQNEPEKNDKAIKQPDEQQTEQQAESDDSPFTSVTEPSESVALAIKRAESVKADTRSSFFSDSKPSRRGPRKIKRVVDDDDDREPLLIEEQR